MRKIVVSWILLLIAFILSTVAASKLLTFAWNVNLAIQNNYQNPNMMDWVRLWRDLHDTIYLPYGLISLIASISTFAAMIIIAVKEFPVFQPLIEKIKARKAERAVAKEEKAQADKQQRIEKLTAELEQLKKDE